MALSAGPERSPMTPIRKDLLDWLERNAPALREPYEAGLRLLALPGFPARVHLIAHLVRDIANRLPDIIEGTTSKRVDYENMLNSIEPLWRRHFHPRPDYSKAARPSTEASGALPSQLFKKLDKLVRVHEERRNRPGPEERLFRSEVLSEAETPDLLHPMEKQFEEIRDWFMQRTHLQNDVGAAVSEKELLHKFESFERVLFALKGQFFTTLRELDAVLQDANP